MKLRLQNFVFLLLLTGAFSCQIKNVGPTAKVSPDSEGRATASLEDEEDSREQHRNTFVNLMSELDVETRHERIKNFMDRQRSFFYIAQELIESFDMKLDEIHKKFMVKKEMAAEEFQTFNELRFKNLIAWEFSERNLHEILDLYQMALESANDQTSPYSKNSSLVLSYTGKWFAEGWAHGDRAAVIQLAEHFEDVNDEVLAANKKARVPSLKKYTHLSAEARAHAFQQSLQFAKHRELTAFDRFINKKWNDHLDSQKQKMKDIFSELYDLRPSPSRSTQALDTLEPDSGPNGHVTGNHFPKGAWAFTFDDGPHPVYTPGMLDNLKSTGIHATFFWLTQNLLKYPELARQAGEAGNSRACHSYTHANLPTLNPAGWNHEIFEALDGFQKIVGAPATMYRCPYGACGGNGSQIRQMIASRQALEIFWNVDTLDWQDKNPQSVFDRAKKQVDVLGRGIILFHDIHPQSVIASKMLMQYIKANPDLRIALLKDLIGESRGKEFSSP